MESLFENKEQYLMMRDAWSKFCNKEEKEHLEPYQLALYALFRRRDWRECFSEHSAMETIDAIEFAIKSSSYLDLRPFGDVITDEHIKALRQTEIPSWVK